LPVGDLADQGVVEYEPGTETGVCAEAGKGLVQVLLAGLGFLRLDLRSAPLQPARIPSIAAAGPTRPTVMSRGADGESTSAGPKTATP
jgi:hypothetical protein